jgi:precorrin-2 dehydrogenase/sirohydrochlorin ferrochelatase
MEAFPAFFPLRGAVVVVAGEGEAAEAKARLFAGSPARLVRLADKRARDPAAYAGATLVFIAVSDPAEAEAMASAARECGAPVNVVDNPELSDFHTPAIVDRGQVVAAVGTAGASPVLASLLRGEIESRVSPAVGETARLLGERRAAIVAAFPDFADRRAFFRRVLGGAALDAVAAGDLALAGQRLDDAIASGGARVGRVSLIEAPADESRLSLRAVRTLNAADILVIEPGAEAIAGTHARRDVERRSARDPENLATAARAGDLVAVVAPRLDLRLAEALRALGAEVDVIAAAPCP